MPRRYSLALVGILALTPVFADVADRLSSYIGYTIIGSKTITGYRDKKGKKSDDFEGCDFDRIIIFDDDTTLTCASYSYVYSYRPKAVILMKSNQFQGRQFATVVMIVDNDAFDMEAVAMR